MNLKWKRQRIHKQVRFMRKPISWIIHKRTIDFENVLYDNGNNKITELRTI